MSDAARPELRRILYVEDDDPIRTVGIMTLQAVGGFEVVGCASGAEAIAQAPTARADLDDEALAAIEKSVDEMDLAVRKKDVDAWAKAGTPGEPHKRLAASVGEYSVVVRSWNEPGAPPMEDKGSASRKMIFDGRVLVEDFSSSMMGTPFASRSRASLRGVCPPNWTITPVGFSTWTISSTSSSVNGSK